MGHVFVNLKGRGVCVCAGTARQQQHFSPPCLGWTGRKVQIMPKYWSSTSQLKKLKYAGTWKAFAAHIRDVCSQQLRCFPNWAGFRLKWMNRGRCGSVRGTSVRLVHPGLLEQAGLPFPCSVIYSACLSVQQSTKSIVVPLCAKCIIKYSYFKSFALKQSCARGEKVLARNTGTSDYVSK